MTFKNRQMYLVTMTFIFPSDILTSSTAHIHIYIYIYLQQRKCLCSHLVSVTKRIKQLYKSSYETNLDPFQMKCVVLFTDFFIPSSLPHSFQYSSKSAPSVLYLLNPYSLSLSVSLILRFLVLSACPWLIYAAAILPSFICIRLPGSIS